MFAQAVSDLERRFAVNSLTRWRRKTYGVFDIWYLLSDKIMDIANKMGHRAAPGSTVIFSYFYPPITFHDCGTSMVENLCPPPSEPEYQS